jgi:hypothetical protein
MHSIDDIPLLLLSKKGDRLQSGGMVNAAPAYAAPAYAAPACGLCLAKVEYEHDDFL